MISKLEELYLSVLRVSVVIVAGLALIAAVVSLIAGAYSLTPSFGSQDSISGGKLEDFIAEQKAASPEIQGTSEEIDSEPQTRDELPSSFITKVAKLYVDYLKRIDGTVITDDAAARVIFDIMADIAIEDREQYQTSFLALLTQLRDSKGKPLSQEKFFELLEWHHERFKSETMSRSAGSELSMMAAWDWLTKAGIAFLMFLAVATYFLFVRVERHLRLVNVVQREHTSEFASTSPEGE